MIFPFILQNPCEVCVSGKDAQCFIMVRSFSMRDGFFKCNCSGFPGDKKSHRGNSPWFETGMFWLIASWPFLINIVD